MCAHKQEGDCRGGLEGGREFYEEKTESVELGKG